MESPRQWSFTNAVVVGHGTSALDSELVDFYFVVECKIQSCDCETCEFPKDFADVPDRIDMEMRVKKIAYGEDVCKEQIVRGMEPLIVDGEEWVASDSHIDKNVRIVPLPVPKPDGSEFAFLAVLTDTDTNDITEGKNTYFNVYKFEKQQNGEWSVFFSSLAFPFTEETDEIDYEKAKFLASKQWIMVSHGNSIRCFRWNQSKHRLITEGFEENIGPHKIQHLFTSSCTFETWFLWWSLDNPELLRLSFFDEQPVMTASHCFATLWTDYIPGRRFVYVKEKKKHIHITLMYGMEKHPFTLTASLEFRVPIKTLDTVNSMSLDVFFPYTDNTEIFINPSRLVDYGHGSSFSVINADPRIQLNLSKLKIHAFKDALRRFGRPGTIMPIRPTPSLDDYTAPTFMVVDETHEQALYLNVKTSDSKRSLALTPETCEEFFANFKTDFSLFAGKYSSVLISPRRTKEKSFVIFVLF